MAHFDHPTYVLDFRDVRACYRVQVAQPGETIQVSVRQDRDQSASALIAKGSRSADCEPFDVTVQADKGEQTHKWGWSALLGAIRVHMGTTGLTPMNPAFSRRRSSTRLAILGCGLQAIGMAGAIAATEPTWEPVPGLPSELKAWVDHSSLKFTKSAVTASVKVEKSDGGGYYLILFDCGAASVQLLGGDHVRRPQFDWSKFVPNGKSVKTEAESKQKPQIDVSKFVPFDPEGTTVKAEPESKPRVAPAGTSEGTLLTFVCDLRPSWRKWLN